MEADAESFARQKYAEQQVLVKHGIGNEITHTVSDVSKIHYQNLLNMRDTEDDKPSYDGYISLIRNHIDPIAGKWDIKKISNAKIAEYEKAVTKKIGRIPSKGTLNKHNIVWRAIFAIARDRKWCSADDLPVFTVKDKGRKSINRPWLSLEEYIYFRRFLRTYHEEAVHFGSKHKRMVLREYCIVIIASGMRPGKEPLGLKWKHIKFKDGPDPVEISLPDGKTKDRQIVPMNSIKPAIRRLKKISNHTGPEDYVFCMPDGSPLSDMSAMVSRAFSDAGLRIDIDGKKRTAYSLRHTYATLNRVYRGFGYEDLAENMGTSVTMMELHYIHAKPTDTKSRYATGNTILQKG